MHDFSIATILTFTSSQSRPSLHSRLLIRDHRYMHDFSIATSLHSRLFNRDHRYIPVFSIATIVTFDVFSSDNRYMHDFSIATSLHSRLLNPTHRLNVIFTARTCLFTHSCTQIYIVNRIHEYIAVFTDMLSAVFEI